MTIKHYFILVSALLAFAACGSDSGSDSGNEGNGNGNNVNSNLAEANAVTHRMEFPRVKGGNSAIITHYDNGEVNYSVEWDTSIRSCRWSCYVINGTNRKSGTSRYTVNKDERYSKQYPTDPDFNNGKAWTAGGGDPFWGSGYDHGHMCPSADRLNTRNANYQTFYLTNMMPQVNGFNAKVWATMETWVRNQVKAGSTTDTLFVVKGGTIDHADQVLPNKVHGMTIPKYYYMAVLMHNKSGYKAMGFWIEHKANDTTNISPYVVNIDTLEKLTGIDFFCNLPDDIENHVESLPLDNVKRAWGFNK
jgi:endonuclease G